MDMSIHITIGLFELATGSY